MQVCGGTFMVFAICEWRSCAFLRKFLQMIHISRLAKIRNNKQILYFIYYVLYPGGEEMQKAIRIVPLVIIDAILLNSLSALHFSSDSIQIYRNSIYRI